MRNIHIFKTDKLTRLHGYAYGELGLSKKHLPWKEGRNIYITSDEEVNRYDYYINNNECIQAMLVPVTSKCKKIILTTDQDLIENGVQAIDDEFLEWFVKNPSCEWVEVVKEEFYSKNDFINGRDAITYNYKIIIPSKEPKYPIGGYAPGYYSCTCVTCKSTFQGDKRAVQCEPCAIKITKEEPKQETIEEAAEHYQLNDNKIHHNIQYRAFRAGAKYQAEKMYSEQDMTNYALYILHNNVITPKEWFKQFKKE